MILYRGKQYDLDVFLRNFVVRGLPNSRAEIERTSGCKAEVFPLDSCMGAATAPVASLDLHFGNYQHVLTNQKLLFLARLSVEHGQRGRGLATGLMVYVLQWAEANGFDWIGVHPFAPTDKEIARLDGSLTQDELEGFYNRFCYGRYDEKLLLQVSSETDFWIAVKLRQKKKRI